MVSIGCEENIHPLTEKPAWTPSSTVSSAQYEELAKAYLELEQAYAAAMLNRDREKKLEDELAETRGILAGVLSSLSWKVTAPLRKFMVIIRRK